MTSNTLAKIVKDESLFFYVPNGFKSVDLTIIILANSGHNKKDIIDSLKRTNEIFAQCSLTLSRVVIKTVKMEETFLDMDSIKDNKAIELVQRTAKKLTRPILYFIRHMNGKSAAIAGSPFYVGEDHPTVNTAWFSNAIWDPNYNIIRDMDEAGRSIILQRDPSYNVIAHELIHILANLPHDTSGEKNLMAGDAQLLNDVLTQEQCKKIR